MRCEPREERAADNTTFQSAFVAWAKCQCKWIVSAWDMVSMVSALCVPQMSVVNTCDVWCESVCLTICATRYVSVSLTLPLALNLLRLGRGHVHTGCGRKAWFWTYGITTKELTRTTENGACNPRRGLHDFQFATPLNPIAGPRDWREGRLCTRPTAPPPANRIYASMRISRGDKIWVTKFQLQNFRYKIWVTKFELQNLSYTIWITNFELQILSYKIWVTKFELQNLSYKIWVTKFELEHLS